MKKISILLFSLLFSLHSLVEAQNVKGKVVDSSTGDAIPGASIAVKGTSNGTISAADGAFAMEVPTGEQVIQVSFIGYKTYSQNISVTEGSALNIDIKLEGDVLGLQEVVVVGSRTAPRSSTDTPLPIDVFSTKELTSTGQPTFDKALQYRVPSFNTVQTPVNDATSLLDPYEIRNMGPSRTLILINGKRKNLSALLYTQTSPGRGETGADISAIPTDAIKRVEILRDGASAQYGSDAIAGVMNVVLKDDADVGSVTLRTGITSEGDGETIGLSLNNGSSIGEDKGFLNYTVDLSRANLANRPGTVDAEGEIADFTGGTDEDIAAVNSFLAAYPDAGNVNGSPETTAAKFLVNGGYDVSETTEMYFNAAYVYKKVNSFANYRTPYWRTLDDFPYLSNFFPNGPNGEYIGYVPTFDGDLNDYNGTIGFRSTKNDWNFDGSFTTGGNTQTYRVINSHNRNTVLSPITHNDANGDGVIDPGELVPGTDLYRENSPIAFDPGGTRFSHNVGNIDISKNLSDKVGIAFGAEFRSETFEIIEGELASYDGGGADSFSGNRPEDSGKFNRFNFGGYLDLAYDITPNFLVNGTVRTENYSDFGNTFVWKFSTRYKFLDDKITLRGSASTGFRAPTLHQIFTQKAQYSFVPGQGIQVGGLVSNVSPQARLLGIDALDAEESTNITFGIGSNVNNNFNFTIDYYNIQVKDRIVLSTEITPPPGGAFEGLSDVSFFANALDTRTSGLDVVANYRDVALGNGTLNFSLAGNYTIQNERDGEVKNPEFVTASGQSVVSDTQEALFFTSRPQTKWILGINYEIGKFDLALNNTFFGSTKFRNQGLQDLEAFFDSDDFAALGIDEARDINGASDLGVEFLSKIVTDLSVNYKATEKLNVTLNVNNIFDVLPEWEFKSLSNTGDLVLAEEDLTKTASNLITFNQRYSQMTYDGYHFSQLGTMFNLAINYRF